MSLADVGAVIWPQRWASGGVQGSGYGNLGFTFNSSTAKLAWIGRPPAGTISKVHFRTGTVNTGADLEVRIETITSGRPSGTLFAANANGVVTVADSDDNAWKTATLTAPVDVSGERVAIVLVCNSGTPSMALRGSSSALDANRGHYPLVIGDSGTGSWAAAPVLCWIVEYSDGPKYLSGLTPIDADAVTTAYNSGSAPDEIALKFTLPFACRVIGMVATMINTPSGGDMTFSIWPASSSTDADALAQISLDGDSTFSSTADGNVFVSFDTPIELSAGQTYYAGLRADTANSISLVRMPVPAGITDAIRAFGVPANVLTSGREWSAGTAGAWADTAVQLPCICLVIDKLDAGGGGGSGGARIIGGTVVR